MVGSLIEAQLFGSMEKDEESGFDHTLIDDSSAQGGDKENRSVGEENSNMCKDVDIETVLMQLHVENGSHEDVELQSELRQALEVLIDEHENVVQSNVKSIVAYVEVDSVYID
jgi:hypothetical protein